jgi:hypothetical protein
MVMLTQTKKQWAAELDLTHEALYRTLAEMRDSGAIRIIFAPSIMNANPRPRIMPKTTGRATRSAT